MCLKYKRLYPVLVSQAIAHYSDPYPFLIFVISQRYVYIVTRMFAVIVLQILIMPFRQ